MTRHVIISCVLVAFTGCNQMSARRGVVSNNTNSNNARQSNYGSARAGGSSPARTTEKVIPVKVVKRDRPGAEAVAGIIKGLSDRIESLEHQLHDAESREAAPTVIQTGMKQPAGTTRTAARPANVAGVARIPADARQPNNSESREYESPFNAAKSTSLTATLNHELNLLDNELEAAGVVSGLDLNQDRQVRESNRVEEIPRPLALKSTQPIQPAAREFASNDSAASSTINPRRNERDQFLPPREPSRFAEIQQANQVERAASPDSLDDQFVAVDSSESAVPDDDRREVAPATKPVVAREPKQPVVEPQPKSVADVQEVVRHAKKLYRAREFDQAEQLFRRIDLAKLPKEDRLPVQYMIAMCLKRQGKTEAAIRALTEIANAKGADVLIKYAKWELAGLTKSETN